MSNSSLYNKLYNINQERIQKITAQNIRAGVNIFGTVGNYTSDANAQILDIAEGKSAYVNGIKTFGVLKEYNEVNSMPIHNISMDTINSNLNAQFIDRRFINGQWRTFSPGIIRNGANITIPYNTITNALGISPTDIKKDVKVFDITGTYDASTEFEGIKMDPVVPSNNAISLTKSISEISGLDTTNGTNMYGFFSGLGGLVSVSNLDLTNATTLNSLFNNDYKLSTLKFINIYNSEVSNIPAGYMFANCNSLTDLDETVRMPKIINHASSMFLNCSNLVNINTVINIRSNVCDSMFNNCSQLQDISNIKFISSGSNTTTSYMFDRCKKLNFESLNLQGFGLNNPFGMFQFSNLHSASLIENIFNNLSILQLRPYMFYETNIDRAPHIENFEHVLANSYSAPLHGFDYLFYNCFNLKEGDIYMPNFRWCRDFKYTFSNCSNLISSNINLYDNWIVSNHSNAYNFISTFSNCSNLTTMNFDCDNSIFYFANTFNNCTNLTSIKMPTNMKIASNTFTYVFRNCSKLENLDEFVDMVASTPNLFAQGAFSGCTNLKYDKEIILYINNFSSMAQTFLGCTNITNNLTVNITASVNTYPTNASGYISGSGFNSVHYIINYTNLYNTYYSTHIHNLVNNCNNVKDVTFDINLNSIKQNPNSNGLGFYNLISSCPNLMSVDYNFAIYNDYHKIWYPTESTIINNCSNVTNINVNMIYGKINNSTIANSTSFGYSPIIYTVNNCQNLTSFNLNIDISTNISYFLIANNCPNLVDINYNIIFNNGFDYITSANYLFRNCPNLSDNLIDNTLGLLNNIPNYRGSKKLSMVFNDCNISDIRYESLNNYAGLIAKGWTIN